SVQYRSQCRAESTRASRFRTAFDPAGWFARLWIRLTLLSQKQWKKKMSCDKTAGEEPHHRDQRRQLQVRKSRYSVTGSATSGVRRAESREKTTDNDRHKSFQRGQCRPREQLARCEPGEIVDAEFHQGDSGRF